MKKRCSKCQKKKETTEFYKHPSNLDGLNGSCKKCCRAYSKRWVEKNRERRRRYQHEYNRSEKGTATKKNNSIKYRRTKNGRDIVRSVCKKYQKTAKGKEANLRCTSKRRSIFSGEKHVFILTLDQWLQTLKYFRNRCAYCGKNSNKLVHEHVIPLERGGWHTRENVIPACTSCNLLKGRKIPYFEWEPPKYLKKICSN